MAAVLTGSTAAAGARLPGRWLAVALLADLAIRLWVAFGSLQFLDDVVFVDDTYYSLQLARAIGQGLGPLYGVDFTNGFQPLYVFLMAPVYALLPGDLETPIRAAMVMLSLWDVAALAMLHRLVARATGSRAAVVTAVVGWVLSPYVLQTTLNGLETMIAAFFLLAILDRVAAMHEDPAGATTARGSLTLGLIVGLGALARIDLLMLAPIALFEWWRAGRRAHLPASVALRGALALAAGALITYAPWLAYSWHYTGLLLPVSGAAVRHMGLMESGYRPSFQTLYGPLLREATGVVLRKNGALLAAIALGVAGLALFRREALRGLARPLRALWPALAFAAALLVAHVFVIFGYWHFARYFFPVAIALLLAFAALVGAGAQALAGRARTAFVAASLAVLVAGSVAHPSFARTLARTESGSFGYMRIGLWTRDHFPAGTVVGGYQSGAIGYFAENLTVINLDGVVDASSLRALRERRYIDHIRARRIEYLIWQDDIDLVRRQSRGGRSDDVTLVEEVPGFRTRLTPWYVYRVNPARPPQFP